MKSISNEIHKLSLLLIGDMDVGKTALVKQYKDGTFNEKTNTNALNIFSISKYLKNDKFEGDITIEIYDCSGYSKYNSIDSKYYNNIDAIIVVYDVNDKTTFDNIPTWLNDLELYLYTNILPVFVIGNKSDLQKIVVGEHPSRQIKRKISKYFEVSALTGKGVQNAFNSIIDMTFSSKIRHTQFSITVPNTVKQNLSTKGLKNEIEELMLEKEKKNDLIPKIKIIESYLDEMSPTICDINYTKYFQFLFKAINLIQDKQIKYCSYINIFLSLRTIFPELGSFLHNFNQNNFIVKTVHSIAYKKQRFRYYKIITENFTNFNELQAKDIVIMYNSLFYSYLKQQREVSFSFLKELSQIIVELITRLKDITVKKRKIGRTYIPPYLITIIESFIDMFIFIIIKSFYGQSNKDIKLVVNQVMISLFSSYIQLKNDFSYLNKTLMSKIICLYSILSLIFDANNCYYANELVSIFKGYTYIFLPLFFDLLYSMSKIKEKKSLLVGKVTKEIYRNYFDIVVEKEPYKKEKLFNWSIFRDYKLTMEAITDPNNEINVYKGLIVLFTKIISKQIVLLYDETKISKISVIQIMKLIEENEKEGKYIYNCNYEILCFLSDYLSINQDDFQNEEWNEFLDTLLIIINIMINKSGDDLLKKSDEQIEIIIKIISNYKSLCFNSVQVTDKIFSLVKLLSKYDTKFGVNIFIGLTDICLYALNNSTHFCFFEPFIQLSFCGLSIDKIQSSDIIPLLDFLNNLISSKHDYFFVKPITQCYPFLIKHIDYQSEALPPFLLLIENLIKCSPSSYKLIIDGLFDNILKQKEDNNNANLFVAIYMHLINYTNNFSYKNAFAYLIQIALTNKELTNYTYSNGKKCKSIALMTFLIEYMNVTKEGKILFDSTNGKRMICYRKKENQNSNFYYIDIDQIAKNFLSAINVKADYHSIDTFFSKQQQDSIIDSNHCFIALEIMLNSLYFISSKNLTKILKLYAYILEKKPSLCNIYILRFLMISNYLLSYQSEKYYLNDLTEQSNDAEFTTEHSSLTLKETIISQCVSLIRNQELFDQNRNFSTHILKLLIFYLNSSLDKQSTFNSEKLQTNQTFIDINTIITYLFSEACPYEQFDLVHIIQILLLFYTLKDILKYADTENIFKYLYIIFILSRPNDSAYISECFNPYAKTIRSIDLSNANINNELLQFYLHLSDVVCLYYISFLNEKKEDTRLEEFKSTLLKMIKEINVNSNRNELLEKLSILILSKTERRSNTNVNEIEKNLNNYQYFYGEDTLYCVKDNTIIEISSVSNYQYIASFSLSKSEEKSVIDGETKAKHLALLYDEESEDEQLEENVNTNVYDNSMQRNLLKGFKCEDNLDKIKSIQRQLIPLIQTPVHFTYHVNVVFYSKNYTSLTLENLLEDISPDEISELYFNFIAQLGDLYIDDNGEKTFAYKDSFYHIIFDIFDSKKTKEEKEKMIKENRVTLLWIDNPYIDISTNEELFNENTFIKITPSSDKHYLIRTVNKRHLEEEHSLNEDCTFNECLDIQKFFADTFYINVNAYSGIRYLLHFIAIACDWYHLIQTKSIKINNTSNADIKYEYSNKANSFLERKSIIEEIIKY